MEEWLTETLYSSLTALGGAVGGLIYPAIFFALLALGIKGHQAIKDFSVILPETKTTLAIVVFNILFITPLLSLIAVLLEQGFLTLGLNILDHTFWEKMPFAVTLFIAVFIMDFASYWRHRLLHSKLLWPSHAVHHSDTAVSWFTLDRAHPIDQIITYIVDNCVLLLLGFPVELVIASIIIRHYYGYFVHADLPWTYGALGKIFVSPVMHRWHHADDPKAYNANYAAVFSLFDFLFGTFYMPGLCTVPLGVEKNNNMGKGVLNQLTYALKPRAYKRLFATRKSSKSSKAGF